MGLHGIGWPASHNAFGVAYGLQMQCTFYLVAGHISGYHHVSSRCLCDIASKFCYGIFGLDKKRRDKRCLASSLSRDLMQNPLV